MTADTVAMFDTTPYQIDGLDRGSSRLRATLSIEYELGSPTAEWVEALTLGRMFPITGTAQAITRQATYQGDEDSEHANKTTVLVIHQLQPASA